MGTLAVQRRPDLFLAYVGIGQLVERDAQELISYDWVVEQARRDGNTRALAELATIRPPYTRLDVSVFLFAGRHDYNTPFALVEQWAGRLQGPHVELVWFDEAGHFIPIEASEEFQQRLIEKLLPLAPP